MFPRIIRYVVPPPKSQENMNSVCSDPRPTDSMSTGSKSAVFGPLTTNKLSKDLDNEKYVDLMREVQSAHSGGDDLDPDLTFKRIFSAECAISSQPSRGPASQGHWRTALDIAKSDSVSAVLCLNGQVRVWSSSWRGRTSGTPFCKIITPT